MALENLSPSLVGGTGLAALAALATTYYMYRRPRPLRPAVNLERQARMRLDGSRQGGPIYESLLTEGGEESHLNFLFEDATTVYEAMQRGWRISMDKPCLGFRPGPDEPYSWLTYRQVNERIANFGAGLVKLGKKPGPKTFVGIYAQNCCEWVIAEHACYRHSMVIVPLYDTLGPSACTHIINQADIQVIVCDKESRVETLIAELPATPGLRTIVAIEPVPKQLTTRASQAGINLISFSDVESMGRINPAKPSPPSPESLATICYTSGTTGPPKGVMLSHGNIIANCSSVSRQLGDTAPTPEDVMISFLPLAHMFELCCETAIYSVGAAVGFYRGDIRELVSDMQALRPTLSPCVPRLLNRIYDKVHSSVQDSLLKKFLLKMALKRKWSELQSLVIRNSSFWDWLVFKKVKESMGGRLRLMVVGSAPIAPNVLSFMRCALGCVIVEGYGQTECTCPCTLTFPGDYHTDHVGPPLPCCSIKLADVPEMEYWASKGKGEICVKGPIVFQGYFKDPAKTAETMDEDGWLHTGDIGTWQPNGTLRIIDRKKYIFKLSQGEYVAPEKIEGVYSRSKLVAQIFIHGESLKSCLVAIVVPDEHSARAWMGQHSLPSDTPMADLCRSKELKKAILDDLISLGKEARLNSFEQVKDICLYHEVMTIENGLLTPTLKTKRNDALKFFKPQIEAMYARLA
ncbi:hypothetical protein LAZ67_20002116 [Cordylochernes scorpioides]|uniref:Long-chain-fatty-acid--CoA ligase n=1 Tax=Cordylochernes scorpioides TaxID=51811 RepID=A0ABY6LPE4_9ARAC|nr:hypothetical protein LAZ67_20002116 [Cordylochernes scorpioides]